MSGTDDLNQNQNPNPNPGDEGKGGNPNPNPNPGGGAGEGEDADLGEFADPKKALAEIKRLRQENAQRRTQGKDIETKFNALNAKFERLSKAFGGDEEDEIPPEEKAAALQSHVEQLEVEASINHLARVFNVPMEHDEYFRFLISQKFSQLEEGEEVGEEELTEIVGKVQALQSGAASKPTKTGLGGGKNPQPASNSSGISADQFKKMGTLEKSALYAKDPALYEKLKLEAAAL